MLLNGNSGWNRFVKNCIGWLHKLDQHPTGVLRVHEVDPRAGGAASRGVVEQPQALGAQGLHAGLDVAIAWYAENLGLVATHQETNEEQGVREAMLHAPDDDAGPAVQLLAPLSESSTIAKFIDRNGPGIQQMAYRVADIEATCAELREKGVRLLYEQPRRGTADSRINFVHPKDAGGVLVELVEPAAAGH